MYGRTLIYVGCNYDLCVVHNSSLCIRMHSSSVLLRLMDGPSSPNPSASVLFFDCPKAAATVEYVLATSSRGERALVAGKRLGSAPIALDGANYPIPGALCRD